MEYKSIKDLPLKIFFEIAETGNIKLLGNESESILVERWEKIVLDYGKYDDNQSIQNVIDKNDQLYTQAALYCEIKAMLLYLLGAEKQEYVDRLRSLGYYIDLTTHIKKVESIQASDRRANHISTRMQIIQKDIEKYSDGKKASFDSVMTWLSSQLGFEPKEDLTVLRYLEYKKQIIAKQKARSKSKQFA